MKHLLFSIMAATILLVSCKKNELEAEQNDQKVNVRFTVSEFDQQVVDYKKGAQTSALGDTLLNYSSKLEYHVYDSVGMFVKSIIQDSTMSNFGQINDVLAPGKYTIYFAAFRGNGYVTPHLVYFMPRGDWYDTFTKKISLTVGQQDIQQQVRLDRIVSALEITLTDPIPLNTGKITVSVKNEADSYSMERDEPVYHAETTKTRTFFLSRNDENKPNKKLFMYVGNTAAPVTVTIRAYSGETMTAEKVVSNVSCHKNKVTLLRGRLFTPAGSPSANFSISVNPQWLPPTDPIIF
ncbi:hypothetical protein [Desertivirga brevis]|uniref:hypothetical protein n=1 Tax=Desertivirga brevis TaxID=2810310 RepID=UPI001A96D35C|nr:hypothetical protein [Pedobacter sp. SYSU D00873]